MNVYHSLTEIPSLEQPISLTIGMFDGMHLGHRKLLKELNKGHGSSVVLTFSNHPSEIFNPEEKKAMLTTTLERSNLFKTQKIRDVIILPFTKEIAAMSYQMFLKEIHTSLPFTSLYIGENDAFGKNREGTKEAVTKFAPTLHFIPHYIEKLTDGDRIISSSWIRECLKNGDLIKAEALLGNPLSFSSIDNGLMKPGKYKVRILEEGENTFSIEEIIIDESGGYRMKKPSTITFITNKG